MLEFHRPLLYISSPFASLGADMCAKSIFFFIFFLITLDDISNLPVIDPSNQSSHTKLNIIFLLLLACIHNVIWLYSIKSRVFVLTQVRYNKFIWHVQVQVQVRAYATYSYIFQVKWPELGVLAECSVVNACIEVLLTVHPSVDVSLEGFQTTYQYRNSISFLKRRVLDIKIIILNNHASCEASIYQAYNLISYLNYF